MPANTKDLIQDGLDKANEVHPLELLKNLATSWKINDIYSIEFANELDKKNLWPHNRDKYFYPKVKDLPKGKRICLVIQRSISIIYYTF